MAHELSERARRLLGAEYARRERLPNEAPPRNYVAPKWEPLHPNLQWQVVRADPSREIKSRGM